jgi:ABC-type uncharacterized transport system permease subunit
VLASARSAGGAQCSSPAPSATATNIGYTLYYATNFIFTGLAVAVAFHAGLFNIGGEGQAYVAGLGGLPAWRSTATVPALVGHLDAARHPRRGAAVGAAWAFIPGWLQAKRGSHIVITTIMFNFIAAAMMVYLLVNVLKPPGGDAPESAMIAPEGRCPSSARSSPGSRTPTSTFAAAGARCASSAPGSDLAHPPSAMPCAPLGHNPTAARYAGMSNSKITMIAMTMSGALAGMVAVNEVVGVQYRLVLDFTAGYGFVGIAVALMGRGPPARHRARRAAVRRALPGRRGTRLRGAAITRDMVVVIQGLVILFSGALGFVPWAGFFPRRAASSTWASKARC